MTERLLNKTCLVFVSTDATKCAKMFAYGVLWGFHHHISCESIVITPLRQSTLFCLCGRGKSWMEKAFPSILLFSLDQTCECVCAKITKLYQTAALLFCLPLMAHTWQNHKCTPLVFSFNEMCPSERKTVPFFSVLFAIMSSNLMDICLCDISYHVHPSRHETQAKVAFGKPESTYRMCDFLASSAVFLRGISW